MSTDVLNDFLHYGYIPDKEVILPEPLSRWLKKSDTEIHVNNDRGSAFYVEKAVRILKKAFFDAINDDQGKRYVVPLSGGLDSRAVLLGLLEYVDPNDIIAVTFGKPGSYDFNEARRIARKCQVKWEGINLSPGKLTWDTSLLTQTAKESECPTWLFDTAVNHQIQRTFGKAVVYWSGFMGDSLGRIQPASLKSTTWNTAKRFFAVKNRMAGKLVLTRPGYDPEEALPDKPYTSPAKLDYYSQLNYFIRQQCLTKHIYSPIGYDIRYPFLHFDWIDYILRIPRQYRYRQFLYIKALQRCWPDMFQPEKHVSRDSGLWKRIVYGNKQDLFILMAKELFPTIGRRMGPIKNVNYIDFDYALRKQKDFKITVQENIFDLMDRRIIDWLDIEALWSRHQKANMDLAAELLTLAALEIHLKVGTLRC